VCVRVPVPANKHTRMTSYQYNVRDVIIDVPNKMAFFLRNKRGESSRLERYKPSKGASKKDSGYVAPKCIFPLHFLFLDVY